MNFWIEVERIAIILARKFKHFNCQFERLFLNHFTYLYHCAKRRAWKKLAVYESLVLRIAHELAHGPDCWVLSHATHTENDALRARKSCNWQFGCDALPWYLRTLICYQALKSSFLKASSKLIFVKSFNCKVKIEV